MKLQTDKMPPKLPGLAHVYKLVDPRTLEARYIGCTTNPRRRNKAHGSIAAHKPINLQEWLLDLREYKLRPKMIIVETVPDSVVYDAERRWISLYRDLGIDLLNLGTGGRRGAKLRLCVEETIRRQLSAKDLSKKRTPETLARLCELNSAKAAARTECKNGHVRTPENTYWVETSWGMRRNCRPCAKINAQRLRDRRKMAS